MATPLRSLFSGAESAYNDFNAVSDEINRKVDAYRQLLLAETAEQREVLRLEWIRLKNQAVEAARAELLRFAEKAWNEGAGGILVVLFEDERSGLPEAPRYRLARVADYSPEHSYAEELVRTGRLELGSYRAKLPSRRSAEFLSHAHPAYGVISGGANLAEWEPELVEVALGTVTDAELSELCVKVTSDRAERPRPADQIKLFGQLAMFKPGDTYYLGSSGHHSGDTSVEIVYLPSGRWAVIGEYSGDEQSATWCLGVVPAPDIQLSISGRNASAGILGESDMPTPEELEFLNELYEFDQ